MYSANFSFAVFTRQKSTIEYMANQHGFRPKEQTPRGLEAMSTLAAFFQMTPSGDQSFFKNEKRFKQMA